MTATLPIPQTAAELEEMLGDTKRMKPVYEAMQNGDTGDFIEIIRAYAATQARKDPDIAAQVKEQVQLAVAEMYRENEDTGGKPPVDLTPERLLAQSQQRSRDYSKIYNPAAPGAKLDDTFANKAEFFQATAPDNFVSGLRNREDLRVKLGKVREVQNAFSSTVPADGGFLIPENLRSELLSVSLESSIARSRSTVIPMDSLRVPIPTVDDTSHASSVFGGVIGYWTEEAAALTASSASFG